LRQFKLAYIYTQSALFVDWCSETAYIIHRRNASVVGVQWAMGLLTGACCHATCLAMCLPPKLDLMTTRHLS